MYNGANNATYLIRLLTIHQINLGNMLASCLAQVKYTRLAIITAFIIIVRSNQRILAECQDWVFVLERALRHAGIKERDRS